MQFIPAKDAALARTEMVDEQLRARGIRDQRVLAAMARVPRHLFMPEKLRQLAYADRPAAIGYGQTISQPLMVAIMLEALELQGTEHTLEVGSGSGYQAALLAELAKDVVTIEVIPQLAEQAARNLSALDYGNVQVICGDGSVGHADAAPYDAIVVAAGAPVIPPELVAQLGEGGRLVIPVGRGFQELVRIRKRGEDVVRETLGGCAFVPLVGRRGCE